MTLLFVIPISTPSAGVDVNLSTTIPEFILDDYITLDGTIRGEFGKINDDSSTEFSRGTLANVTVDGTTIYHKPELKFDIMNNGNAILEAGGSSSWDPILRSMYVLMVNDTYLMYYTGGSSIFSTHIGLATSTDGTTWTKYSGNPVLKSNEYPGDPDRLVAAPIVYHNGTTFFMYYCHWNGAGVDIHLATSTDGTSWTKYANNPVIDHGADSTKWNWDIECSSIYKDGSTYSLYYSSHAVGGAHWLGLATSTDLIKWTPHPSNPLRKGDTTSWEKKRSTYGTLEKSNGTYRLWSSSGDGDTSNWWLGWLWSSDAVNFIDSGSAIMSPKAGTIYAKGLRDPVVFDKGDHYIMFSKCYDSSSVIRYCTFKVTPQKMNGTYASKVYDAGGEVEVLEMDFTSNTTWGGNMDHYISWSNDSVSWSSWIRLNGKTLDINPLARYLKYKVEFNSTKDWMRSRLDKFEIRYYIAADTLKVMVGNGPWMDVTIDEFNWSVTLNLTDGDYDIILKGTDTVMNEEQMIIPVKVDLFPPTGNLTLNYGKPVINNTEIGFTLQANDTHEVTHYKISTLSDLSDASWQPFSTSGTISWSGPNGVVKMYGAFRDEAGRESQIVNDTVIVDTNAPTASVLINNADIYTNLTRVDLVVEWFDITDIVGMKLSTTPDVGEWGNSVQPTHVLGFELGPGEGERTIYVWLINEAGWTTVVNDTIILDTLPPLVSVLINDDEPYTNVREVTLGIEAYDEAPIEVMIRNKGDIWPPRWQYLAYPASVIWPLTDGDDGSREVRVRARDKAGNMALSSDTIVLDTTPPRGELLIDAGASYTGDTLVRCGLIAEDDTSGVYGMRVSNRFDYTGISIEPIISEFDWTLLAGDGLKNVYIQLEDGAGLTATISAMIILDVKQPEGYILIDDGAEFTTDESVTVSFTVTDALSGVDVYRISEDSFFNEEIWESFSSTITWNMSPGEGDRHLFAQVRDVIGNVVTLTDSIILDTRAPTGTISIWGDIEYTGDRIVRVYFELEDETSGVAMIALSESPGNLDPDIDPPEEYYEWTFEGDEGVRTIFAVVSDHAGNLVEFSDSIFLDVTPPSGTVVINGGAVFTNSRIVTIEIDVTDDGSGIDMMAASNDPPTDTFSEWIPIDENSEWELPAGDGPVTVYVAVGDKAGHIQYWYPSIILDTTAPVIIINGPINIEADSESVTIDLNITDAIDDDIASHYRIDNGAWKEVPSQKFKISVVEGKHDVEIRAIDAAGNEAIEIVEVNYSSTFKISSASLLFIIIIIVVVALAGYYNWKKRAQADY